MENTIGSRVKRAWNAFLNRDPTLYHRDLGVSYSYRPDRPRLTRGNERSIVASVVNRIALDVAAIDIQHVDLDENNRFLSVRKSNLNNCLTLEANIDQTARAFKQDAAMSMLDEGCIAIVPVDTLGDPIVSESYEIYTLRVGKIVQWYPKDVRVELYNENKGYKEEIVVPKYMTAIIENPLYAVMNEPNSTLQRLIRKLNLLDVIDEQSGSGKLDLIIQLPYVIKTPARRQQAEDRRKDIEEQLSGSKYGIAYTDGTERIGKYIGEGLAQGIRDETWQAVNATAEMADKVKKVASKTFEDVEKYITDAKHFDELSLAEELEIWETFIARYAEGTEERLKAEKKAYTVYKALVDEKYQHSMDWIDQEKYYNRLSLEEELAAYERVQARYKWGSEEWLKMEREKYRVRNEIVDASYQHSMDWIDQEKYYNRLSLYDELAAYKRVQSRYAQDTDEYKKMAREIYRVQNEINDANENFYKESIRIQEDYQDQKLALEEEYEARVKEINERLEADIKTANDAYDNALESRTKSLYDAYSLWDKIEPKETIDGADLFTNLQSQVDAFEDWQKDINELAGKGINAKLLEELQEMGPSSAAEIKALNKLSTHELNSYVELWQEKYNLAKEQATFELEDVREDTKNQIKQLRADAKIELDEYTEMWNEQMSDLKDDMNDQLDELRDEWMDTIGTLRTETKSEFTTMTEQITNIVGEKNNWSELGSNIVEGVLLGIVQKSPVLTEGVVDTMTAALEAAKETLGIQSPSKAFAELGMYSDKGFAAGLMQYASVVSSSATQVGKEAVSSLSNSISRISSMVTDGMDAEPTIRPVLDLSNIQNGVKSVNSMFNPNRTLSLGLSLGSTIQSQTGSDSFKNLKDTTIAANDKVVSAIDSLKEDVSTLADAIRNIKLVMDTGALVGAISPEMDRSLGQIAAYNKRGI